MFANFFFYIKKKKFISNFKTLSLGILFSQLIIFAAMPILTRLYLPEIFASYALFISLCVHAIIEGMALTNPHSHHHHLESQSLLLGIVIHKIPIAIVLVSIGNIM